MKWGRRKPKPCSSSMSRNPAISHVFPMSWLSKFKHKGSNSDPKPTKENQSPKPPILAATPYGWREGRFYGVDDDSCWRLSFGEERMDGEKSSRGGLQSVLYDSDDDEREFASSSCKNCRGGGERWKFNDMVSDIRKSRELPRNEEISQGIGEVENNRRKKAVKEEKRRKTSRRDVEEKREGLERRSDKEEESVVVPEEKDIFELEPIRITRKNCYVVSSLNSRNTSLETIEEDFAFKALNLEGSDGFCEEKTSSEWQKKLKGMKIDELLSKSEKQRKSVMERRTKQNRKVKVYSPRTVARMECKIKALEDMKRAKRKMKNKNKTTTTTTKEGVVGDRAAFDRFAVVKSSVDPQTDFRNSMIEMITEKGIRGSEELEELLACYLTLNADEYHDLIIKVFRQVWFELNRECVLALNHTMK